MYLCGSEPRLFLTVFSGRNVLHNLYLSEGT